MSAIIGITTSSRNNEQGQPISFVADAYSHAVQEAGGVPVLIPSAVADFRWEGLYPHLDGLLFSGGGDIETARYGGETHHSIFDVEPLRDALELALLRAAIADGKPFLGICRGCQLVNVGLGGTLYVHVPDQLPGALDHDQAGGGSTGLMHNVRAEGGTRMAKILAQPLVSVNSHHHQGLRLIGTGLRVGARAPDGLVEAIELPDHPFGVAVQWHPERLRDESHARRLFRAFVDAATGAQQRDANRWLTQGLDR